MKLSREYKRSIRKIKNEYKRNVKSIKKINKKSLRRIKGGDGIISSLVKGSASIGLAAFFSTYGLSITAQYAKSRLQLVSFIKLILPISKKIEDAMRTINEKIKELNIPELKGKFDSINNLFLTFDIKDSVDCNLIKIPSDIKEYLKVLDNFMGLTVLFGSLKIIFDLLKNHIESYIDKFISFLNHKFFQNFNLDEIDKSEIEIFFKYLFNIKEPRILGNTDFAEIMYDKTIDSTLGYKFFTKPILKKFIESYKDYLKQILPVKDKIKSFILEIKQKIKSFDIDKYKDEIKNLKQIISDIVNFKCEKDKKIILKDNELLTKIQSSINKIKQPFNSIKDLVEFLYKGYDMLQIVFNEQLIKLITLINKLQEFVNNNTLLVTPSTHSELIDILLSPTKR